MSNIYIPIDASNLREEITPGEDIVYSTIMRVQDSTYNTTTKFDSHVLLTPNGIAWTDPRKKKKKDPIIPKYANWDDFRAIIKNKMGFWGQDLDNFELLRLDKIETKEEFKNRAGLFPEFVLNLVVDYGKRKYAEMESDPSVNEKEKKKMRDFIQKKTSKLEKAKIKADKIRGK